MRQRANQKSAIGEPIAEDLLEFIEIRLHLLFDHCLCAGLVVLRDLFDLVRSAGVGCGLIEPFDGVRILLRIEHSPAGANQIGGVGVHGGRFFEIRVGIVDFIRIDGADSEAVVSLTRKVFLNLGPIGVGQRGIRLFGGRDDADRQLAILIDLSQLFSLIEIVDVSGVGVGLSQKYIGLIVLRIRLNGLFRENDGLVGIAFLIISIGLEIERIGFIARVCVFCDQLVGGLNARIQILWR